MTHTCAPIRAGQVARARAAVYTVYMSIDDPQYVPPVLDSTHAWPRSFTPRSMPTVRPCAAEAEAIEIFEAALRTDEHTARLDNVGRAFRGVR